jgi:hypothetical protein
METNTKTILVAVAAASIAVGSVSAFAAGATSNVRGTIAHIQGDAMQVKERNGSTITVHLASDAKVASVATASISDVKPGMFIGTAAMPQPNGTLEAKEIHIFPQSMRGTGEGNRAWDMGPGRSMTNGTVGQQVGKVEGNKLTVSYGGGEKAVAVTPNTKVVKLIPSDRSDLKPNEQVFIPGASRNGDGSVEASRLTVGKDGVAPPM